MAATTKGCIYFGSSGGGYNKRSEKVHGERDHPVHGRTGFYTVYVESQAYTGKLGSFTAFLSQIWAPSRSHLGSTSV